MMKSAILLQIVVGLLFERGLACQPLITSVVDSAQYDTALAWGELVTIFGTHLSEGIYQAGTIPLPTMLGSTQVFKATANCNPVSLHCELVSLDEPLELLYVGPDQINFRLSVKEAPAPTGSLLYLTVKVGQQVGQALDPDVGFSNPVWRLFYLPYAPQIFGAGFDCPYPVDPDVYPPIPCGLSSAKKDGQVARASMTDSAYALVSNSNPAKPGKSYTLWVTGFGFSGKQGDLTSVLPTNVYVRYFTYLTYSEGLPLPKTKATYVGSAAGFEGLYQVNFAIPKDYAPDRACGLIQTNVAFNLELKDELGREMESDPLYTFPFSAELASCAAGERR